MRILVVGLLALVSTAAFVSACGSSQDTKKTIDSKTPSALTSSDQAQKAMVTPDTKAVAVNASTTPRDVDTPSRPVRYTLVLNEGKSGFLFNTVKLSDEAKAKIDEMFGDGKVDVKGAHFEIEGHTDNVGSKEVNERIGLERAEAVRQYICQRYEVPMESIAVVSFGLEKPIADNTTEEGRAQNRRVVIKVVD